MIERTVAEFAMPYREPFSVKAFSFGVDGAGLVLGEGASAEEFEPSLFLIAGLRGDEVQQMFICSRLVSRLGQMERNGELAPGCMVTVVPCANPASMGIGWRFWPGDKTDVNRMFPGYDQGETTQRIAAALFEFSKGYRYGVHFSSFYLQGDFVSHVRIMHGPGQSANNGADFGLPYVLHHVPGSFDTTTLHYNWRLWDTEAYTLYTKETALVDSTSASEAVQATLRFMVARGIATCMTQVGVETVQLGERALVAVRTATGGMLCPNVALGDAVRAGDELASIEDPLYGTRGETLLAPCDGVVFYTARTPLVNEGALAFQVVPTHSDAAADSLDRGNFLDPEA